MGGKTEHLQQIGLKTFCVTEPKFELRALTGNRGFSYTNVFSPICCKCSVLPPIYSPQAAHLFQNGSLCYLKTLMSIRVQGRVDTKDFVLKISYYTLLAPY